MSELESVLIANIARLYTATVNKLTVYRIIPLHLILRWFRYTVHSSFLCCASLRGSSDIIYAGWMKLYVWWRANLLLTGRRTWSPNTERTCWMWPKTSWYVCGAFSTRERISTARNYITGQRLINAVKVEITLSHMYIQITLLHRLQTKAAQ